MENFCLKPISILVLVILGVVATTAQASEFAAHRGLYNLSLVQARSGNGISNAIGKMAIEWNNNCTGWAFQYHSIIDVTFHEGAPVRLNSNASSWESGDGRNYRFSVRHKTNDKEMEHIEGFAKLTTANGAGTTQFTHPQPLMIDLPRGTLFPVAHSLAIMRAAKKGRMPQFVSRTVFDGMDVKGLYQVNAVIGPVNLPQLEDPDQRKLMKGMPSWPVNLAYFAIGSSKAAPDHEVMMLLFSNGVVDDLIIDFEDFIVRARLSQVELFPEPSCR